MRPAGNLTEDTFISNYGIFVGFLLYGILMFFHRSKYMLDAVRPCGDNFHFGRNSLAGKTR
jgi:hypothetical protein